MYDMRRQKLIFEDSKEWVNPETGEVKEGIPFFLPTRVKEYGWVKMYQEQLAEVATDKELDGTTLRVLMICLANMQYENYVTLTQAEIAEILKIKQQNVSRAVKKLVDKGILIKDAQRGRYALYRVCSGYSWKGSVTNRKKRIQEETKELPATLHTAKAS